MSELGTLVIVVLKARDLPDKHTFSKQDPYAQLALGGKTLRTSIDPKGGQHPVWDEEIRVKVPKPSDGKNRSLEVSCWAKEPREDDLIGKGVVDITETLKTGEFDDWVLLENNGTQRGSLYLEMTFYAAGPAPLSRRPSKMKPSDRLSRPVQAMQTISETPAKTSPKTPPQSHLSPHTSPKINQAPYSPPTTNGRLAPPSALTPGPRNTSPKRGESPLPGAPKEASLPPLLRPGNLSSPPKPLATDKPLPPNDPVHARLPDPWDSATTTAGGRASPPVSASAYPPSEGALGLLPLPGSFPAGPSPAPASIYQSQSTPWHQQSGVGTPRPQTQTPIPSQQYHAGSTPWHHLGGTGPPHPTSPPPNQYQTPSAPWIHPGGTGPPHLSSSPAPAPYQPSSSPWQNSTGTPYPQPQATPNSFDRFAAPQFPSFDTSLGPPSGPPASGYGNDPSSYSSAPFFPVAMTAGPPQVPQPYGNTSPARAFSPAYPSGPPSIPDPYNPGPTRTPGPQHLPPPTRQRPTFPDESAMPTPKAELQPSHSPAQPASHLRHSSPSVAASATSKPAAPGRHPSDRDEDVAREVERIDREAARRRREDEERDLELARELDRVLNAPGA